MVDHVAEGKCLICDAIVSKQMNFYFQVYVKDMHAEYNSQASIRFREIRDVSYQKGCSLFFLSKTRQMRFFGAYGNPTQGLINQVESILD